MKQILLWLDDTRDPLTSNWLSRFAPNWLMFPDYVVWVKSYTEFVSWIELNPMPQKIAFDHDLGIGKSGYDAVKWLIDYCVDNSVEFPSHVVQSANPIGKENIEAYIASFKRSLTL